MTTYPKCLIYGLVDPRTLMVRYVGLSSNGLKRAHRHRLPSVLTAEDTHKTRWIRSLLNDGLDYQVVVLADSDKDLLVYDEKWWIAYGRASEWQLTNATDGGEGLVNPSEATRARMRAARVGLKIGPPSAETREKIGAGNRGKKRSAELRARWSAQRLGRKHTPEARAKISAANRARISRPRVSAETREKIRLARTGSTASEESRRKNAAAHRGMKRSEETKTRMREAWVRRRACVKQGDRR